MLDKSLLSFYSSGYDDLCAKVPSVYTLCQINIKTTTPLNERLTCPTGGWCGVGLQEASGLRDGAQVVPDQRETQHPCQGGGADLEQLQQRRLLHPRPRRGEDSNRKRAASVGEHCNGDCPFGLQTIVSWIGSQANIFEKQKVREIASLIRDTDRHGKARIVDISEGEEPEEMLKVSAHFYYVILFQEAWIKRKNYLIIELINHVQGKVQHFGKCNNCHVRTLNMKRIKQT